MAGLRLAAPEEEAGFRTDGFLLLRQVFSASQVRKSLLEVRRIVEEANESKRVLREPYYDLNSYKLDRVFRWSRKLDRLIDHEGYFGRIVSLMGAHIQLMGTEIFVRGSSHDAITGFHTDLGPGLQKILPGDDNLFLQIKAQIFLTDLACPYGGNFALIPGSHNRSVKKSDPNCYIVEDDRCTFGPNGDLPPGAIQVLAEPGDVLLFPHSLWHAVAPNRSGRIRQSITLRYGQTALRPMERFDDVLTDSTRRLTARQRRLLGDFGDLRSPYNPPDQRELIYGRRR